MLLENVLYGGFIVYDTDAKRKWIKVDTPSVYSDEMPKQMAEGALKKIQEQWLDTCNW